MKLAPAVINLVTTLVLPEFAAKCNAENKIMDILKNILISLPRIKFLPLRYPPVSPFKSWQSKSPCSASGYVCLNNWIFLKLTAGTFRLDKSKKRKKMVDFILENMSNYVSVARTIVRAGLLRLIRAVRFRYKKCVKDNIHHYQCYIWLS